MALLLHVTIALLSIFLTTCILIAPSKATVRLSFVLVISTLVSGTYLVASTHTSIVQACMMGLFYVGISLFGLASAHRRLALAANRRERK